MMCATSKPVRQHVSGQCEWPTLMYRHEKSVSTDLTYEVEHKRHDIGVKEGVDDRRDKS